MGQTENIPQDLWSLTIGSLRKAAAFRKWLQGTVLAATAVTGAVQLMARTLPDPPAILTAASICAIVWIAVVGTLLLIFDTSATDALVVAHDAKHENEVLGSTIEQMEIERSVDRDLLTSLSVLYTITIVLREMVGPFLTQQINPRPDLKIQLEAMLDVVVAEKAALFGITDEFWTLAVYLPTKDGQHLECSACRRRDRADEQALHRVWPIGHGHVGRAFNDRVELIAEDTQSAAMEAYFKTPRDLERVGDAERYRSVAAIPIRLDNEMPSGILIATSSRPGQFKPRSLHNSGPDFVEPLRALAATLGFVIFALEPNAEGAIHA